MMASARRRRPGWTSAQRAKQLAYFERRIRAREAADPVHAHKVLFRLAEHAVVSAPYSGLSAMHDLLRRSCVLRAWCAIRIARVDGGRWREAAREELAEAKRHRQLARAWRREGR